MSGQKTITDSSKVCTRRIGIVTRYDDNYGACLQAAALQKALVKLNAHGEILRFVLQGSNDNSSVLKSARTILLDKGIVKTVALVSTRKYAIARKKAFAQFRSNEIKLSNERYVSAADMQNTEIKYDAFLCGSDMIWCEEFLDLLDVYFLTFAAKGKRIAFSPSFGIANVRNENLPRYRDLISGMDSLACRETSGVSLIRELTNRTAEHTTDPTLLLTRDEWETIAKNAKRNDTDHYVLLYLFSQLNKNGKKMVDALCGALKIPIRSVPSNLSEYINEKKHGIVGHGPYEFLSMYSNADFIVTSTFHGLVFALIFNKPFLVLKRQDAGNWAKYDDRLVDLLETLNLKERYITQDTPFRTDWLTLDYTEINKKIEAWRDRSIHYLEVSLNTAYAHDAEECGDKGTTIVNKDVRKNACCTGCGACIAVCPQKCIVMKANDEGFLFPHIDEETCLNCGQCDAVCPIDKQPDTVSIPQFAYCAITKNREIWKQAASGGVAGTIADWAMSMRQASVAGCAWDETFRAKHIVLHEVSDIARIQNSKYVQSDTGSTYQETAEKLKSGEYVLYFGTPCQIAGLVRFLHEQRIDDEKLLTVDHVCHGVPSPAFFEKFVSYYQRNGGIVSLGFRKAMGLPASGKIFSISILYKDGGKREVPWKCDAFYSLFMRGIDFRESCYQCQYANTINKYSDFTIGDCDSGASYRKALGHQAKSIIVANTSKAVSTWAELSPLFRYVDLDLDKEVEKNHQLKQPFSRPSERNRIYKKIMTLDYTALNRKYASPFGLRKQISLTMQKTLPASVYRWLMRKTI